MKINHSNKVFPHNDETIKFCSLMLAFVFMITIYDQGFSDNIIKGMIIAAFGILFLIVGDVFTEVRIENSKTLINKVFLSFGFKAEIKNITRIGRSYEFIFKNWGCRMEVYYLDEYNLEHIKPIQESIYTIEDIKELLRSLKEINPSIKLHQHYQDLIDGKIEDESKFKKMRLE